MGAKRFESLGIKLAENYKHFIVFQTNIMS